MRRVMAMLGATIGSYRLTSKLGEGGMGTVYVAEHVLLGRRVAIKMLLPELSANREVVARFFNEARALTALVDPGIVQLFDFGNHGGAAYIVMELLEGESLWARQRRIGRLAALDAVRLMRQCAVSLGAAHDRGIIHRDLKPENLFVVGDPAVTGGERLKLLDFGVAKLAGPDAGPAHTRTGIMVGTPIYMSPEQCRSAAEIDARSDVYAFGCVLFTLVAGRPPFDCASSGELIAAHLREAPPSLAAFVSGVPHELDAVIQCCLAKAPADRFASMAAVIDALDRVTFVLYGVAPSLTPPPLPNAASAVTTLGSAAAQVIATPAPRRRSAFRVLLIASVAVIAVVGGLAAFSVATRAPTPAAVPASAPPPDAAQATEPIADAGIADAESPDAAPAPIATMKKPRRPRREPAAPRAQPVEEPSHGSATEPLPPPAITRED